MNLLIKIFPLPDHLYIFQTFEYAPSDFSKWFLRHFFKRNLQRKHSLNLTTKALFLLVISFTLISFTSVLSSLLVINLYRNLYLNNLLLFLIFFFFYGLISPLFLITASFLITPIENNQKHQLIKRARQKLYSLPDLKIVAIVGSYGKTSTKNMLYTLLWKKFRVVKTPKSYNTPISIARSILEDIKDNTEIFLVEMDAYHQGEIDQLCNFVKPHFGIVTAIAPQHLERFGDMKTLAKTQFELVEYLSKNGTVFINTADSWSMKLLTQDATYQIKNGTGEIIEFGERPDDDFYADHIIQTQQGLKFNLHIKSPNNQQAITIPLFGQHHIINFVSAAAIATKLGMNLAEIAKRASKILPTPHRLEIKKQSNITIIDNTYNTNPAAAQTSLTVLSAYPGNQKILITPGLVELGKQSSTQNQIFAKSAAKVADLFIIVGENSKKDLLKGLNEAKYPKNKIISAKTIAEALEILQTYAKPLSVVLLENDLPDQYF